MASPYIVENYAILFDGRRNGFSIILQPENFRPEADKIPPE